MAIKKYCLASPKGGSGKTMLCASFAAFIAGIGKKVLIIDVDEATHGLTLLFLNEVSEHIDRPSMDKGSPYGLFDGQSFASDRDIVHLNIGVDFLPATFDFKIEEGFSENQLHSTLQEILKQVKNDYDYIFLDAQAGADIFSRVAMRKDISDEVIIVTEYDPLCAAGVERLKAIMRDELTYVRTWVLLNKMLPEFVETFSDFLEISKYLSPIPWDAEVVRALCRRRLPTDLEYGNQFTLALMQTLKGLLGPEMSSQIEAWAESRASNIREPIEEQYKDAELELKGLLEMKAEFERTTSLYQLINSIKTSLLPTITIMVTIIVLIRIIKGELIKDILGKPLEITGIALFTVICLMTFIIFVFSRRKLWKTPEREVEEARFHRQMSILEDKLKRLEILRKADLPTLVKERKKE